MPDQNITNIRVYDHTADQPVLTSPNGTFNNDAHVVIIRTNGGNIQNGGPIVGNANGITFTLHGMNLTEQKMKYQLGTFYTFRRP